MQLSGLSGGDKAQEDDSIVWIPSHSSSHHTPLGCRRELAVVDKVNEY